MATLAFVYMHLFPGFSGFVFADFPTKTRLLLKLKYLFKSYISNNCNAFVVKKADKINLKGYKVVLNEFIKSFQHSFYSTHIASSTQSCYRNRLS